MIKVKSKIFLVIVALIIVSGCSNNDEIVNELSEQLSTLTENKSNLEDQIESLTQKNTELQNQLDDMLLKVDEYENGSQALLIKIRNAFENDKNEEVVSLAEILHEKFIGTADDIEGQKIAKEAVGKILESEKLAKQEEDRKAAEALKSAQDKARELIRVTKVSTGKPNSVGGVDLYINWKNKSEKTIKYVYFEVTPYNSVDDVVTSDIGSGSLFRGKETGPFKTGEGSSSNTYWDTAWYNNTIVRAELHKIDIEYMDGTTVTLKDDEVAYVQY
jgi:outer membrane murein-binding lipoprotein Lpp